MVQTNIFKLALYLFFFPKIFAGPIMKYKDFKCQLDHRKADLEKINSGVLRFIIGLGKKVIIANNLAYVVDSLYKIDTSYWTTPMAWLAIIGFALQIYFDFSGYADMAIGLGLMFGFNLPENFDYPYLAKRVGDFWKRWNMSLYAWFEEYFLLPLNWKNNSLIREIISLSLMTFLMGIWYGTSSNIILWAVYITFFIVIEALLLRNNTINQIVDKVPALIKHIYLLIVVVFGWVIFKGDSIKGSWHIIKIMLGFSTTIKAYNIWQFITPLLISVLVTGVVISTKIPNIISEALQSKVFFGKYLKLFHNCKFIMLLLILVLCCASIVAGAFNPFIYNGL